MRSAVHDARPSSTLRYRPGSSALAPLLPPWIQRLGSTHTQMADGDPKRRKCECARLMQQASPVACRGGRGRGSANPRNSEPLLPHCQGHVATTSTHVAESRPMAQTRSYRRTTLSANMFMRVMSPDPRQFHNNSLTLHHDHFPSIHTFHTHASMPCPGSNAYY